MLERFNQTRSGRAFTSLIAFLVTFGLIVFLVSDRYLLPALKIVPGTDERAKKQLVAISSLVLAIILVLLLAALILLIRPGRFFFPRKATPRTRTPYVDAWSESAIRMETPPPDQKG